MGHLAAEDAAIVEAALDLAVREGNTRSAPGEGPMLTATQRPRRRWLTCAGGFWTTTTRRLPAPDNVPTFPLS